MTDDPKRHVIEMTETPSPPDQVFALATPDHMLAKLYWEIKQLEAALSQQPKHLRDTHAPSYHAFNCAVTAWHLVDWCWEAASEEQRSYISQQLGHGLALEEFKKAVVQKYRVLRVCQQIANGSKHMILHRPDPSVRASMIWKYVAPMAGRLQAGQPLGSYDYHLLIFDNEVERTAVDVFQEAFCCWHNLLSDWGFAEAQLVTGKPST